MKEILDRQIMAVTASNEEIKLIKARLNEILVELKSNIKKRKIKADVFLGGSYAKNTLIRKKKYDIDIFVRFDKTYGENELSNLLAKIVPKRSERLHGSRDYFVLKQGGIEFEFVPTIKIARPELAKNVTDLSYFHVNYVKNKIAKNKKLSGEIRLAKSFFHSSGCYGAESYINGFSGYGVELLVIHYKSFINMIKAIAKADVTKKIIIDDEKSYGTKEKIEREMNESKLFSPIILIDPTFKERNALAALSESTFIKFQSFCRKFLANPSDKFFELENRPEKLEKKYGKDLIKLFLSTDKQAGDIAGTKLKKFYKFFINETKKYFDIMDSEFVYDENANIGNILLVANGKKEIIFSGPPITMKEPLAKFKKEHKNIKIKSGKAYAIEKNKISFKEFLGKFQNEKSKTISEMDVIDIKILE